MGAVHSLATESRQGIVGQAEIVDEVLMALLAGGHACSWACPGSPRRC